MKYLAAIFAVLLYIGPASAQMACGPRDAVIENLGKKYGEIRRGGGLASPTTIYEVWISEETGSWTILKTSPNGISCIMAVGNYWKWYPNDDWI